ncbi:MAG: hypothetical protein AAF735_05430 [Myxococcota bacterium]
MKKLQLTLLENALDFVVEGINTFFATGLPEARAHKYGILHLISGVSLLVKERIRREHPALVFTRVEQMQKVDAHTVSFDVALERLAENAGVQLESRWKSLLSRARKERNRIEHYQFKLGLADARALISELVEFVYVFMRDHLADDLRVHVEADAWREIEHLREIASDIEERRQKEWLSRAKKYFDLSDDELAELADIAPYHPKHNPEPEEVYNCDQCGEESLIVVERDIAVCTNTECAEVFEVPSCLRCDAFVPTGELVCDYCAHMMSKD